MAESKVFVVAIYFPVHKWVIVKESFFVSRDRACAQNIHFINSNVVACGHKDFQTKMNKNGLTHKHIL